MSAVVVAPLSLTEFNRAAESDAHGVLGSCLDIERWVLEVDVVIGELRKIAVLRLAKAISR